MKDTFRFFIRKNFVDASQEMSNEDIDELGIEFHEYLDKKLSKEIKEKILPKSQIDIIMNMDHPLKTNGFEPTYVLHFTTWINDKISQYS